MASSARFREVNLSPPPGGVFLFWGLVASVLLGFALPGPLGYVLLTAAIPVIYASHEALHETLIPRQGPLSRGRTVHNELALTIGFTVQLMNFRLLRPAHLRHHVHGRADQGYAPDVVVGKPSLRQICHYYVTLLGFPAFAWQLTGFVAMLIPRRLIPFENYIKFEVEKAKTPFWLVQAAVALFAGYAIAVGGLGKFLIYNVAFCVCWSMLQNVSHYGLVGIDSETDRVCARSYQLPWPFSWLTFGSTFHLAHHVDMKIPGLRLYDERTQRHIEEKLGLCFEVRRGIWPFLRDVFRQFLGPVETGSLSTAWILESNRLAEGSPRFAYRKGSIRTPG